MNKYEEILNAINKINPNADKDLFKVQNNLRDCLFYAANCEWSKDELADYIQSKNDILDTISSIEEESELWIQIRDIQFNIINSFYTELDEEEA